MIRSRRFLLLLAMLSAATFGMAQTIIVKDSITYEAVPLILVIFPFNRDEFAGKCVTLHSI